MPETVALTRLAVSRYSATIVILIAWSAIGLTISAAVTTIFDQLDALPIMIITMLPAAAWSLALFDFGSAADLMDGKSGYSRWLLRMPIASWKLALVPITLRTVWICVCWYLFALAARQLSGVQLPVWSAAAVFSAMGVWASVISWRPFSNGWWRLGAILVAFCGLYALLVIVLMVNLDPVAKRTWLPAVKLAISTGGFVALALGVACALRALELARTNSDGLIPSISSRGRRRPARSRDVGDADDTPIRDYGSPRRALVAHDVIRLLVTHRRWMVVVGVLFILFVAMVLPYKAETVVFVLFFSGYMSVASALGTLEQPENHRSSLPNYLAASPLTSAEIGFTRAATMVMLSSVGLIVVALIFAGWTMWPENRMAFGRWVDQMADQYGSPMAAYRIILAWVIGSIVYIPTRSIVYSAAHLTGKPRLHMMVTALPTLALLGCVALATGWMLRQTDWESATANAWYWVSWVPTLGVIALAIKLVSVAVAAALVRRSRLITARTMNSILAGWIMSVLLLSLVMFWLIPDDRVLFWWCLLATAIVLPLANLLILPYSIHLNRHR